MNTVTQKVVVRQTGEAIALLVDLQRQMAGEEAQAGPAQWAGLPGKSAIVEAALWHWLRSATKRHRREAIETASHGETKACTFYLVHAACLNEACGLLGLERAQRGERFPTKAQTLEAAIRVFADAGSQPRRVARQVVQGSLGPMHIWEDAEGWRATRDAEQALAKE